MAVWADGQFPTLKIWGSLRYLLQNIIYPHSRQVLDEQCVVNRKKVSNITLRYPFCQTPNKKNLASAWVNPSLVSRFFVTLHFFFLLTLIFNIMTNNLLNLFLIFLPMFRIHEILVRIRIRGSIPLTNGSESGCGSGSCYFFQWPSRRQQVFLFITFRRYIYITFQR